MGLIIIQLMIIILLTILNAFFAASEMALVSVDKVAVQVMADKGNNKAIQLSQIIEGPNKFLATIQVGITLAGFFSSASAATGLASVFGERLEQLDVPFGPQIAVVVITIILSYFILVFGELLPKRIALSNPIGIALFSVEPIKIIGKITAPFVKILTLSLSLLMKIFHIEQAEDQDLVTEEKLRYLLQKSKMDGTIKSIEEQRIHRIFEFDNIVVKEIMVPIEEVFTIDIDIEIHDFIEYIASEKYSRVPIYEGDPNNILGILRLKRVFEYIQHSQLTKSAIIELLDIAVELDKETIVDQAFLRLQKLKKHMAIVKDKHNEVLGIVTIEDMIEEIFGNIDDEFDI